MNNPDKHNPLSAEELFKLLDNTSNKVNDLDGLDEFEKEALEGFSAHSDAQKAKHLVEELNMAISKKVTSASSSNKNKIIWFSAAASIVLIIMVSVFFFNQSKEDSVSNIALNELKDNEELKVTGTELQNPPEAISENSPLESTEETKANSDIQTLSQTNNGPQKTALKDETVAFNRNGEGAKLAGGISAAETTVSAGENRAENKPNLALAEKAAKDESKNRNEYDVDDLKKQGDLVSDNLESKKKEKLSISQEQAREESSELQNLNTTSASNKANNTKITKEEEGYYKADADKTVATKKTLEKEKVAKPVSASYDQSTSVTEVASGKVSSATASAAVDGNTSTSLGAYYNGSELAIRDYVLKYLKEKQSNVNLLGTYKLKGTVLADGKLKVNSIIQITKVNCNCESAITEALNTMSKWNPAIENGKKVSSSVEFVISF